MRLATTGFWPVKGRLKDIIDYAENPEKTTNLSAALDYATSSYKTDKQMFVSGINCSRYTAYKDMVLVKRHYGERGKNIAYHGFQSFSEGEVTPQEAHEIGLETARRMWGDGFQVIVATHLNTENIHNHFVINSVSFKDGKKFRNQIGDHMELRKISDAVCKEKNKSVLENAPFYGGEKDGYWLHKKGCKTHRDILKEDVEYCLQYSDTPERFIMQLKGLGYEFDIDRMSVRAKSWKKSVRLKSLGFDTVFINQCLDKNYNDLQFWRTWNEHLPYRPKKFPLEGVLRQLEFSIEHSYKTETVLVDTTLYILLVIIDLAMRTSDWMLLSPDLRAAVKDFNTYQKHYDFLKSNNIKTRKELLTEIRSAETELKALEERRDKLSNKIRRTTNNIDKAEYKELRKDISRQIKPVRERLHKLITIDEKAEFAYGLLQNEHRLEKAALVRERYR